ncbi:MAG: hypothetical protein [Podoviridae sp. cty5g4]|nr:MAG: hypothetical protein [Podoviridae sp. cty5g4]
MFFASIIVLKCPRYVLIPGNMHWALYFNWSSTEQQLS